MSDKLQAGIAIIIGMALLNIASNVYKIEWWPMLLILWGGGIAQIGVDEFRGKR